MCFHRLLECGSDIRTGPLYVPGAPDRTIEPGKAVLATVDELKGMSLLMLTHTF